MGWEKFCRIKPINWQGRERVLGNSLSVMLSQCSSMVAIPNCCLSSLGSLLLQGPLCHCWMQTLPPYLQHVHHLLELGGFDP